MSKVLGPVPSFTLKTGMKLAPMMQQLYDAIYESGMQLCDIAHRSGVEPTTLSAWFSTGRTARLDAYDAVASTVGKQIKLVDEKDR